MQQSVIFGRVPALHVTSNYEYTILFFLALGRLGLVKTNQMKRTWMQVK